MWRNLKTWFHFQLNLKTKNIAGHVRERAPKASVFEVLACFGLELRCHDRQRRKEDHELAGVPVL